MKTKKTACIIGIACAILLVLGGITCIQNLTQPKDLREKYPLILERDYAFDEAGFSFEDRISMAPNVAEVEVVKRLPDYSVTVGDVAYGTSKKVTFCQYKVKLISSIGKTDIVTDADGTFTLIFAKNFSKSYPALDKGTQAICSIGAAAGNEGQDNDEHDFLPANYALNNMIVVGASTFADRIAIFSNYGQSSVDLFAPGNDIYSTTSTGSYDSGNGTSFAALMSQELQRYYCLNTRI